MSHKRNGKAKANKSTTMQQNNEAKVSIATRLAEYSTETPDTGSHGASEITIR